MKQKKDIPLEVLKVLEDYADRVGVNYIVVDKKEDLIRFNDINADTDFFFHIKKCRNTNRDFQVLLEYKPYSEFSTKAKQNWVNSSNFSKFFNRWLELIDAYNKVKTPFDDPIVNSFKDYYYSEFHIVDDEKNKPLEPKNILLLDNHLKGIEDGIDKHKNESNAVEIDDIKSDISELRDNLSSKTRIWIAEKLCWIWAKITKLGPKIMDDFINEGRRQLIKKSVTHIINATKELL